MPARIEVTMPVIGMKKVSSSAAPHIGSVNRMIRIGAGLVTDVATVSRIGLLMVMF